MYFRVSKYTIHDTRRVLKVKLCFTYASELSSGLYFSKFQYCMSEHYVLFHFLFLEVCDASWEQSAAVTPTLGVSRYLVPEPPLNSSFSQCSQQCHNLHATLPFAETSQNLQNLLLLIQQKHMGSYKSKYSNEIERAQL